mgnify:CR=1 FL=1
MALTQVPNTMMGTSTSVTALAINSPIYENNKTVTASYTVTLGSSAVSVGPITLNTGVTVTLPSGSRWVIL